MTLRMDSRRIHADNNQVSALGFCPLYAANHIIHSGGANGPIDGQYKTSRRCFLLGLGALAHPPQGKHQP